MALNGMELMLKSMGLGDALGEVKKLAESGAVQKILDFADGLDDIRARLTRIEGLLEHARSIEPGSSSAVLSDANGKPIRLLETNRAD